MSASLLKIYQKRKQPYFTVNGKMEDVMQIHSLKSSAEKFCQGIKSPLFDVVPCTITYTIPKKKKK